MRCIEFGVSETHSIKLKGTPTKLKLKPQHALLLCADGTCIRRQIKVKNGDDGDEDAGEDDV